MQTTKTLAIIAAEYGVTPKTLSNHIKKHEILRDNIVRGLQLLKSQKLMYDTLGYPPGVDKKMYENV